MDPITLGNAIITLMTDGVGTFIAFLTSTCYANQQRYESGTEDLTDAIAILAKEPNWDLPEQDRYFLQIQQ